MGFSGQGAAAGATAGAAFGPWGAVIGGIAGGFLGKSKAPKAAAPAYVDPVKASEQALQANNANFKGNSELATRTNDFNQGEAQRMLEKAMPGFSALQQKLMAAASDDLSGKMPADVQANLSRLAAEKGINRGTSGGFNQFSMLRDMGVNMLDWQNASRTRALATLSSVYGMSPRVSPMSPMSMFITPQQTLQNGQFNEQNRYNAEQSANNAGTAAGNYNAALTSSTTSGAINGIAQGLSAWKGGGGGGGNSSGGGGNIIAPGTGGDV